MFIFLKINRHHGGLMTEKPPEEWTRRDTDRLLLEMINLERLADDDDEPPPPPEQSDETEKDNG